MLHKPSAFFGGGGAPLLSHGLTAGDIPAYRPTDQPNARWIVHTDDLDAWVRSWPSYRDAAQLALDGATK